MVATGEMPLFFFLLVITNVSFKTLRRDGDFVCLFLRLSISRWPLVRWLLFNRGKAVLGGVCCSVHNSSSPERTILRRKYWMENKCLSARYKDWSVFWILSDQAQRSLHCQVITPNAIMISLSFTIKLPKGKLKKKKSQICSAEMLVLLYHIKDVYR